MKKRKLLFSLTKKDFKFQTFRSGGKGGQHQNKTESGVRIVHPDSGAVGESREERSQHANKKIAFHRLTETPKFKAWHKLMCAQLITKRTIDELVEEMLQPENLKIEVKNDEGRWVNEGEF